MYSVFLAKGQLIRYSLNASSLPFSNEAFIVFLILNKGDFHYE